MCVLVILCVYVCVCAQLTIEKDKLKEAQRLIWESEAKVGFILFCMHTTSKPHLQSNVLHNEDGLNCVK